jgi:MFS family permease
MDIKTRATKICLTPSAEWPVIAQESTPTATLITGYVMPLAAIGAVAGFIGGSIVGMSLPFIGRYRVPIASGIAAAVFAFVMAIVGVFILSLIINALAPTFGAEKNQAQALKVAVYSYTPAWLAGALQILPALGVLGIFAGLYGLYLLYLGLPALMKCPPDKAVGYTVVVVLCAIVLTVVTGAIGGMLIAAPSMSMTGGLGSVGGTDSVQVDRDSPLGQLEALGQKLEESGKKMEAAEKSGDAAGQTAAAFEALGTLLGGGKRVDPIAIDQLKPFVPETFAGLSRRSNNVERTGMAGLMVTRAEASYSDGADKNAQLEITDTGGVSGLVGLAGWVGVQGEKETEDGFERTRKVDGRLVHEKMSKTGGTNEFGVVLGDRFVVSAQGDGVSLDTLKSAVSSLDLEKLETLKSIGVTK